MKFCFRVAIAAAAVMATPSPPVHAAVITITGHILKIEVIRQNLYRIRIDSIPTFLELPVGQSPEAEQILKSTFPRSRLFSVEYEAPKQPETLPRLKSIKALP